MDKKRKGLILSVVGIITVILITAGVTYAFFNYAKEGTTDNVITTGSITFLYTETSGVGNGISIENAFPISDEVGKVQTGEGEYFDFKITSDTTGNSAIPYEVTARKSKTSDDIDESIRVYLTKGDEEVLLDNYNNLTQTSKVDEAKYTEKTIYNGKVPSNTTDYEETFRLRMWVDEDTRFENEVMNDKTFTLTVNVYANAKVVTEEEIALESNTTISTLSVEGTELTAVEGQDYDYETTLPEDTTSTTINIKTENPNATVTVEKIDSLATSSHIKRLAVSKTLELTNGDNYFKVTVTSENKKVENEYTLKISVGIKKVTIFNKEFEVIDAEPTLTDSSNNTSDASGLYKWTNPDNKNEVSYYFRGNVNNNYVDFAGHTWRVVRINEDGTIRLVKENAINNSTQYAFNSNYKNDYKYIYYSNSSIKSTLENWYNNNINISEDYSSKVAVGNYFCEAARVSADNTFTANNATLTPVTEYIPTFVCEDDGNELGIINSNIGLITYDEAVYAGAYYEKINTLSYLLKKDSATMSPAGFGSNSIARIWVIAEDGEFDYSWVNDPRLLYPVINVKPDIMVSGTGASDNHWVVQ